MGIYPGFEPGGYWTQFVIPDGVLDLFEKELGDRWLGMDNGEQDGRYVGSFAPRLYPLGSRPQTTILLTSSVISRKWAISWGIKWQLLSPLNFGHYFLKEGVYTLIGAETAQGLPNSQIYYSFIRGAGKQYGVNWFGNASVWNRWGYKTYDSNATGIDDDYNSGGSLKGNLARIAETVDLYSFDVRLCGCRFRRVYADRRQEAESLSARYSKVRLNG